MALDHYVSQVHLKNFYSPKLNGRMYAICKKDHKSFTTTARNVCRIEDGNTNLYLNEPRIIEDFLVEIESKYNKSLYALKNKEISHECIYTFSGFIAYILTCSPTSMRLNSSPLQEIVSDVSKKLDADGKLPPPPQTIGGKSLTELLDNQIINIEIDPKYPQAIGISNILDIAKRLGNCKWDILFNPFEDSPFFTSDYPISIEEIKGNEIVNKIVPLSPDTAIRICPDFTVKNEEIDLSFSKFEYRLLKLNRQKVAHVNRLIVRSAENLVFYRDNLEWVPGFIKKHSCFRIETKADRVKFAKGTYFIFRQRIAPFIPPPASQT